MLRHQQIMDIALREGRVEVESLAQELGVAAQTIRRDLSDLAAAGKLQRVHGGAILPSSTSNIAYERRRQQHRRAKHDIGAACAADLPPGAALFLNIGTTTEAVAHALPREVGLMVVTNNLNLAAILSERGISGAHVTGGRLRPEDGGLVGPLAAEFVARFRFDIAIIGCSAIDPTSGDLLDFDLDEVAVSRAAIAAARAVWVVADASKLSRHAPARICGLADIDRLYTDRPLPGPLDDIADRAGVRVLPCGG